MKGYNSELKDYNNTGFNQVGEVWKKIPDFEDYDISNYARVRKFTNGYFRYPSFSVATNGALKVALVTEGRKIHGRMLSKLVYETFSGTETMQDIIYADGDKQNCAYDNLWLPSELIEIAKEHNALKHKI